MTATAVVDGSDLLTRRKRLRQPGWRGRVARTRWRWRRLTGRWRVLPDFLVLGAHKAGTSSLFDWLARHPDVEAPWTKELQYFAAEHLRPLGEYRVGFPLAVRLRRPCRHGGWLTGEATPEYLYAPWVPPRVAAALPRSTRFLVVLREPRARLRSHHAMAVRYGWEPLGLAEAVAAERDRLERWGWDYDPAPGGRDDFMRRSYLARGLYADQLERWLEVIDASRILVLRLEDLLTDPTRLAPRVEHFLGIGPALATVPFPHHNAAPVPAVAPEIDQVVGDFYAGPNRRLADLVGISWDDQVVPRC